MNMISHLVPKSLLVRKKDTHKGNYGHVLIVAGSVGLSGAPVMCAKAALRSGAGLVSVVVPGPIYPIVASQLMEGMVYPLSAETLKRLLKKANCIAIGPGLGREARMQATIRQLVLKSRQPVVLDADGITAFSGRFPGTVPGRGLSLLKRDTAPIVITPHPGEMADFLGTTVGSIQRNRLKTAKTVAQEFRLTVVLKGHETVVASSTGKTVINQTGNPGMATAGMGDILTGMIAALIGQGFDPFTAAKAAVYLHGLAGDIAAKRVGQVSLIAGDVLDAIPQAFLKLTR